MKKCGFFSRFIKSMSDFDFYRYVSKSKPLNAILYIMVLTLILNTVSIIRPAYKANEFMNEVQESSKTLPEFSLKDGRLKVEGQMPLVWGTDSDIIFINTDDTYVFDYDEIKKYDNAVVLTSKMGYIKNQGELNEIDYNIFESIPISNDTVIMFLPKIKSFIFLILGAFVVLSAIVKLIATVFVFLLGLLMKSIAGNKKYDNKAVYVIGIYTMTLPMVLKTLRAATGIRIPFFILIYYGIIAFYMYKVFSAKETVIINNKNEEEEI